MRLADCGASGAFRARDGRGIIRRAARRAGAVGEVLSYGLALVTPLGFVPALGLDALLKRALIPSAKQTAELLASRFSAWAAWATVAMKTRVGLSPMCGWRYLRCA